MKELGKKQGNKDREKEMIGEWENSGPVVPADYKEPKPCSHLKYGHMTGELNEGSYGLNCVLQIHLLKH